MKPLSKLKIKWSSEFAYAIGLLTTDGNLSIDGRHISFSSKDKELVEKIKYCLNLSNKITRKARGGEIKKKYYLIQFGDVNFYHFLLKIGLMPNKSKILSQVFVPDEYFFDFLRGHFDGDGTCYSYWDPRWRSSYMYYLVFLSASKKHILWLRRKIKNLVGVRGHITGDGQNVVFQLKYAKKESNKIIQRLYYQNCICLERKLLKIQRILSIINQ
jgi:hypothetical protein